MQPTGLALLVEDNPDAREWLAKCLGEAFPAYRIENAADLASANTLIKQHAFDLALVDLRLPDGNGMDIIRTLRSSHPDCQVVVATIYDDDRNLFAALKAGAQGYILKDQDKDKIISHLLGLQQDRPAISAATSRRLIDHFNRQGNDLERYRLTGREHEVLVLLSKGYTIEQTADTLRIAVETVRGYVKSLYSKLGINNRAELTLIAVRLGLAG
ncbi:MAG TPA: response regulator transcription factor [Candidatus Acidoferrum sp.]|nr:response regulator transcription factor [Candidatus Acidoferrum sp.]